MVLLQKGLQVTVRADADTALPPTSDVDDNDIPSIVDKMKSLADQALYFLNYEHKSIEDQRFNYGRAIVILRESLELFEKQNCTKRACPKKILTEALYQLSTEAEIHLEVAEYFTGNDYFWKDDELEQAKKGIDKGVAILTSYTGFEEKSKNYFANLAAEYLRVQKDAENEKRANKDL
jgi:hypothetical protein